ncbi:MAG: FG-GAP repeat domain-containing protein [Methyloligellaceae bacterium]
MKKINLLSYTVTLLLSTLMAATTLADSNSRYPNAIPDLRVAKGNKDISEAWFSHPTKRYRHFVLGSDYEAGTLNIRTKDGVTLSYSLTRESVFEDRIVRLHDMDNDGKDEIIVVRAYLKGGAALAVFGLRAGKIAHLAETPDMGHPFGWLNPAGIADFDGDGVTEIAFVRKPHVLGRLELWEYRNGKLTLDKTLGNTSNHSIGSAQLGLSMVYDFNGDGLKDLAIPSKDRRSIRFLSFKGDIKEFSRKKLPAPVTSDFRIVLGKGMAGVAVTLSGKQSIIVFPDKR